ncbi:MAG: nucleotidyltransferase domain-containing protein, partial [Firmicutes bacterium]|nr:nucleotidyltransferase domain-containing protein [Bacillota bacterium]
MGLRIEVPKEKIAEFCRKHHVKQLAFFGSVLRDDFGPNSDVDVLVEFEPDAKVGFIRLAEMEMELGEIIGRKVDLNTAGSLSPYFREVNKNLIPLISFYITDESFAVSITDVKEKSLNHTYFLGLYITSYLSWVLSTILGSAFGSLIPDTKALGFDFALPGMFLALLCMQLKDMKTIAVALAAGALSMFFIFAI